MSKVYKPSFKKVLFAELKEKGLERIISHITSVTTERYSGGSSARVRTRDLFADDREALEKIVDGYQHGSFDGMQDLYTYQKVEKPLSFKYTFTENEFSEEIRAKMRDKLASEYGVTDDESCYKVFGHWYDRTFHRKLYELKEAP